MWRRVMQKGGIRVEQVVTEEGWNGFKIVSEVSWPGGDRQREGFSNKAELIPTIEIELETCMKVAENAWADTADKKLREAGFSKCY
jgi:hypothetical protein